jgi:photosystem II stability/assembly factor-like uncharacterized protein
MKRLAGIFVLFLITGILDVPSIIAQNPVAWEWLNPIPQGKRMQAVSMADVNIAIAVGSDGTMIRTTDAGVNWSRVFPLPAGGYFKGVDMVTSTVGYVSGNGGVIMRTDDGGLSWEVQTSGTTANRLDVEFKDSATGIVVGMNVSGDYIQKTTDGGSTWNNVSSPVSEDIYGVTWVGADTVFSVGNNGTILRSIDAGDNFSAMTNTYPWSLRDVAFADADTGVAVGGMGLVLRTIDGGVTWDSVATPYTSLLNDVDFAGQDFVIATGSYGVTIRSQDAGLTWSDVSPDILGGAISIDGTEFVDVNNGFAVGAGGYILKSTDGGANWTNSSVSQIPILQELMAISMADDYTTGHIVAKGTADSGFVYRTSDAGVNWTWKESDATSLYDIFTYNDQYAWAVGAGGYVTYSNDYGSTWNPVTAGSEVLTSVFFTSPTNGTVVGWNGSIQTTTDGGANWTSRSSGTSQMLNAVTYGDSAFGTIVGAAGTILRTMDGGISWIAQSSGTSEDLLAVTFYDEQIGWASGNNGTILHTINGGATWVPQSSPISESLVSVQFPDPSNGYAISNNYLLRTTDGGNFWKYIGAFNYTQNDMHFLDAFTGWGVGWYASILMTESGGADSVDVNLPAYFFGGPGDTVKVPIKVDNLLYVPAIPVLSFDATLIYPDSVLHFIGYDTIGTASGGFSIDTSFFARGSGELYDTLHISAASLYSLNFSSIDVLLDLAFTVDTNSVNGEMADLIFDDFLFNEGFPGARTFDGDFENARLHLYGDADYNGQIQAADVSLVLQTAVNKYTPVDSMQIDRMDVSDNGDVRAFDAALILQNVAGVLPTFPAGTTFVDKAMTPGDPVPTLQMVMKENGALSVTVELTGVLSVQAAELQFEYDNKQYQYTGYRLPEAYQHFFIVTEDDDGILDIALASMESLESDGVLIELQFRAIDGETMDANIQLTSLYLNEYQVLDAGETIATGDLPQRFHLAQNYPNPFNPSTTLRYQVPEDTHVRITIYNLLGQEILKLVDGQVSAGLYQATWQGLNSIGLPVASGVYLYRMEAGNYRRTMKMLYLK